VGITVVFVTHDQEEALSLSDRIAVMEAGEVMQVGTPQELYEKPGRPFVRDFLGKSVVLRGEVTRLGPDGQVEVRLSGNSQPSLLVSGAAISPDSVGQPVMVAVRPEDLVVEDGVASDTQNRLEGVIVALLFLGDRYECHLRVGEEQIVLYFPRGVPPQAYREGQTVRVYFPPPALSVWRP